MIGGHLSLVFERNITKFFLLDQTLLRLYLLTNFCSAYNTVVENTAGQQGRHIYEVTGPSAK